MIFDPRFAGPSCVDRTSNPGPSASCGSDVRSKQKVPICRAFQAADGTRTHDLLHGKRTPIARLLRLYPCNSVTFGRRWRIALCRDFAAFRRDCVPQVSPRGHVTRQRGRASGTHQRCRRARHHVEPWRPVRDCPSVVARHRTSPTTRPSDPARAARAPTRPERSNATPGPPTERAQSQPLRSALRAFAPRAGATPSSTPGNNSQPARGVNSQPAFRMRRRAICPGCVRSRGRGRCRGRQRRCRSSLPVAPYGRPEVRPCGRYCWGCESAPCRSTTVCRAGRF
jgi:hypothetical protein